MSESVFVTIGGEQISVSIEGGNMAAGASVAFVDLNQAVSDAEQAAADAATSAAQASTAGALAGAAAGASTGASAGSAAGTTAGTAAANVVVANKVNLNADNLTSDAQKVAFKAGADIISFKTGPARVVGSRFGADWLAQLGSNDPTLQGGQWGGGTDAGFVLGKTFTTSNTNVTTEAPLPGLLTVAYSEIGDVDADVCAFQSIAVARATNGCVFGGNIIAGPQNGATNVKVVGLEIDTQWATGATAGAGSGGLYINTFGANNSGNAIYIFGHDGYWSNGIKLNGINPTAGAGLSMDPGASIGSLVNSTQGTFATAAIDLGTGIGPGIRLNGAGGTDPEATRLYNSGGFTVLRLGTNPLVVQNNAGTSIHTIDTGGNVDIAGSGAVLKVQGTQVVGPRGAAVANATDAASAITQLNALLARMRTHGLIAP